MKKNRFVKIASALVMMCLITTCAIGSTFAKYTTGGSVNDQARVAKWGVEVSMDADHMFSNEYEDLTNGLSVRSEDAANVVAPGTSSSEVNGGLVFKITGAPEVKVKITISLTGIQDVRLNAGTYYDGTQATKTEGATSSYETFTQNETYYPVVFTLKQTHIVNSAGVMEELSTPVVLKSGTLAELQAFFDTYSATAEYAPNTVLDSQYELTWAWAFNSGNDKADTLLGNLMAGPLPAGVTQPATDAYNLEVAYTLNILVEQVD